MVIIMLGTILLPERNETQLPLLMSHEKKLIYYNIYKIQYIQNYNIYFISRKNPYLWWDNMSPIWYSLVLVLRFKKMIKVYNKLTRIIYVLTALF